MEYLTTSYIFKAFKGLKDIFKETLKEILNKFKENGFVNPLKTF